MTRPDIITSIYGVTPEEMFRLATAYTAIRSPDTREEFLSAIEAWAQDQWVR